MEEFVKFGGAILWIVGLVGLFIQPVLGVLVLLVALLVSAGSVRRSRQRRHQELINAARHAPQRDPNT